MGCFCAVCCSVLLHVPFSSFDAAPLVPHSVLAAGEFAAEAVAGTLSSWGVHTDTYCPRIVCSCGKQEGRAASFSSPWRVLVLHSVVDIPLLLNFSEIHSGERQKTADAGDLQFSRSTDFSAEAGALDKAAASSNRAGGLSAATDVAAASVSNLSRKLPPLVYVSSCLRRRAEDADGSVAEDAAEKKVAGKDAAELADLKSEAEKDTRVERTGTRETAPQDGVRGVPGDEAMLHHQQGRRRTDEAAEEDRGGVLGAASTSHKGTTGRRDETPKKVSTGGDTPKTTEDFSVGGLLEQSAFRTKGTVRVLQRPREGRRLFCILTHASAGAAATFISVATARVPAHDCCSKSAVCTGVSSHLKFAPGGEDGRSSSVPSATMASSCAVLALGPSSCAHRNLNAEQQQPQVACRGSTTEALSSRVAATASARSSRTTALLANPTSGLPTESPFSVQIAQQLSEPRRTFVSGEPLRDWSGVPWLIFPFFFDQPMIAARLEKRGLAAVASELLLDYFEELAAAEKKVQAVARKRLPGAGAGAAPKGVPINCTSLLHASSPSLSAGPRINAPSRREGSLDEMQSAPQSVSSHTEQPPLRELKGFEGKRYAYFQPHRRGDGKRSQQSIERETEMQRGKESSSKKAACKGVQTTGEEAACARQISTDTQTCACRLDCTGRRAEHVCVCSGACGNDHGAFATARETNCCPPSCAHKKDTCCTSVRQVESPIPAEGAASARQRGEDDKMWNTLLSCHERELSLLQQKLVRLLVDEIRAAVWQKEHACVGLDEKQDLMTGTTAPGDRRWSVAAREGETCHTSAAVGQDLTARAAARVRRASTEGTGGLVVQEDGARVAAWAILALLQQQERRR